MKVLITKYALTEGIKLVDVIETHTPTMVCEPTDVRGGIPQHYHGEGNEWHRTVDSARFKAKDMQKKKIASLKKSLAKLEKLCF